MGTSAVEAPRSGPVATIAPYAMGVAAGLGAIVFWLPVITSTVGPLGTNDLLVGVVIAAAASFNAYLNGEGRGFNLPLSVLITLLGVWTAVAPFVLGTTSGVLRWSTVIAGALVAVSGAFGLFTTVRTESERSVAG